MWINYSDSEVRKFHPICEKALINALKELGVENDYCVEHHEMFGSIEADFAIKNINTNKYLCIVEVKRTLSDIQSTRYQYQAMSYVQSAGNKMEKPFYLITNLEYTYSFRFDASKSSNLQQMLEPGLVKCAIFDELGEDEFLIELSKVYLTFIKDFLENRYKYIVSIDKVLELIEQSKSDLLTWRTNIAILAYEYIRGAFESVGRTEFRNIHLLLNDVYSIFQDAAMIDFSPLFKYDRTQILERYDIDVDVLNQIYNFGKQNINGEIIANAIHQIVSRGQEGIGEVPTDVELAYYIAYIVKIYNNNREIDKICDPAAGSGSLIGAAISVLNLAPIQVVANDINEKLLQVLSLRLGLAYVDSINLTNTVSISCFDIANLNEDYFSNVDIVLMNPPYVSGIREGCREKKELFSRKIKSITNENSLTNVGQIGLECVFIELVSTYLKDNTLCAYIIPKQYLYGAGRDSVEFRKYLMSKFGLKAIFIYPSTSVFKDVIKDTAVIVGQKGNASTIVSIINVLTNIQDVDANEFVQFVQDNYYNVLENNTNGDRVQNNISIKNVERQSFIDTINEGWDFLSVESVEKQEFIIELLESNKVIRVLDSELYEKMSRGRAGNSGGSDLIFSKESGIESINAVRNAKIDNCFIEKGDSFFELNEQAIGRKIRTYLRSQRVGTGSQNKKIKNQKQLEDIYEEAKKSVVKNAILIPRNLRKNGSVYYTIDRCMVSTNFMIIDGLNMNSLVKITSWMRTIFYQCICEIYAKPQEGTRKLEKEDFAKTYIPNDINLTDDEIEQLKCYMSEDSFVELSNPQPKRVDHFWAKKIFGDEAEQELMKATRLLRLLSSLRQNRL